MWFGKFHAILSLKCVTLTEWKAVYKEHTATQVQSYSKSYDDILPM